MTGWGKCVCWPRTEGQKEGLCDGGVDWSCGVRGQAVQLTVLSGAWSSNFWGLIVRCQLEGSWCWLDRSICSSERVWVSLCMCAWPRTEEGYLSFLRAVSQVSQYRILLVPSPSPWVKETNQGVWLLGNAAQASARKDFGLKRFSLISNLQWAGDGGWSADAITWSWGRMRLNTCTCMNCAECQKLNLIEPLLVWWGGSWTNRKSILACFTPYPGFFQDIRHLISLHSA